MATKLQYVLDNANLQDRMMFARYIKSLGNATRVYNRHGQWAISQRKQGLYGSAGIYV